MLGLLYISKTSSDLFKCLGMLFYEVTRNGSNFSDLGCFQGCLKLYVLSLERLYLGFYLVSESSH